MPGTRLVCVDGGGDSRYDGGLAWSSAAQQGACRAPPAAHARGDEGPEREAGMDFFDCNCYFGLPSTAPAPAPSISTTIIATMLRFICGLPSKWAPLEFPSFAGHALENTRRVLSSAPQRRRNDGLPVARPRPALQRPSWQRTGDAVLRPNADHRCPDVSDLPHV